MISTVSYYVVCIQITRMSTFPITNEKSFTFNMSILRHYLRTAHVDSGDDILRHCFYSHEPGALELLQFCLSLRANRRTRKTAWQVRREWARIHGPAKPQPSRWYNLLVKNVVAQFRHWRKMAYPVKAPRVVPALQNRLSRSLRRMFGYAGVVRVDVPTLRKQALSAADNLRADLDNQAVVLWVDNWYWERYGTSPANPVLSQNVTAIGVLVLSSTATGPAQGTRSHQFPTFPGHLGLHHCTVRVDNVAASVVSAVATLVRVVQELSRQQIASDWIRVPLDVNRQTVSSLQWRALMLTQQRVSHNEELLAVLNEVRRVQTQLVKVTTPLLVDEKIHYSVCRLMYSVTHTNVDVCGWLRHVPLLYGVWHPYKQALHLVYRVFFPILGILEHTGDVELGKHVTWHRKIIFMEKMFAALLLAAYPLRDQVESAIGSAEPGSQTQSTF